MEHVWVIAAEFEHDTKPNRLDPYTHVLFVTEEIAVQHLNKEFGEMIAQSATIDTLNDPELEGYWLGDVFAHRMPISEITALYEDEEVEWFDGDCGSFAPDKPISNDGELPTPLGR